MCFVRSFLCLFVLLALIACGGASSTASPTLAVTSSPLPSATIAATITIEPSATLAPTLTSEPSATLAPTLTSEPSATPEPTATEVLIVAATLTPQPEAPAGGSSSGRIEALIAQLAADGLDVSSDQIVVEGDIARVTHEANGDTIFVFYRWEAGVWNWLSAGSMFDPESAARLGIPESLLP